MERIWVEDGKGMLVAPGWQVKGCVDLRIHEEEAGGSPPLSIPENPEKIFFHRRCVHDSGTLNGRCGGLRLLQAFRGMCRVSPGPDVVERTR